MTRLGSLRQQLAGLRAELLRHPIYAAVGSPDKLCRFMEGHVFAVWDFMSLLKRLQRDLTCVRVPWTPPRSPVAARFINEMVTAEESDVGPDERPVSHFEIYLAAMAEVGANTAPIQAFIREINAGMTLDAALTAAEAPEGIRRFVSATLACAQEAATMEVAAAFLFGREDVIPDMFARLLDRWDKPAVLHFSYYLRRHVALDRDIHGPHAERLLEEIAGTDARVWGLAANAAERAIKGRLRLWDHLLRIVEGP